MSKDNWKFWIIPLGLWGLYCGWYMGFQAGYDDGYGDGYSSVWGRTQPVSTLRQIAEIDKIPDPDEQSDSTIR